MRARCLPLMAAMSRRVDELHAQVVFCARDFHHLSAR
jgi:hypothetical protein